ncbi:MAG: cytochrome c family protein [Parvibaculaceae bacterium]
MSQRSAAAFAFILAVMVGENATVAAQETSDGERQFRQRCAACHALAAGQNKAGPHLDRIIGRRAGSVEGARYSRALQNAQIVWDETTLDSFLANPRKAVPGTTMMIGVPNEGQRKSIIAYLKSLPAAAD